MDPSVDTAEPADPLTTELTAMGQRARAAAAILALASSALKDDALRRAAQGIRAGRDRLLEANARDRTEAGELSSAQIDRLTLTPDRIEAMAAGLEAVAALADPVGRVLEQWTQPNGLHFARVAVPLGVIGIIYEARPNVTADAAGLCLKSGNAAILRCGSECFQSSMVILDLFRAALAQIGLPVDAVQAVPTRDRAAVGVMLGLRDAIDIIVPRGGKSLIARVAADSRIPVIAHLDGNCHVYVDRSAASAPARAIVMNAKLRRTGVCGAAETLLVDRAADPKLTAALVADLLDGGCEIRGDADFQAIDARVRPAAEADWSTEFLDAIIAARMVDGVAGAIDHINRYGSHHTDAILTEDAQAAELFLSQIDSAIVLVNASTQFADGAEFGFGAEIGISTGKLHARGPVGAAQLTSYKYVVRGTGQVRP